MRGGLTDDVGPEEKNVLVGVLLLAGYSGAVAIQERLLCGHLGSWRARRALARGRLLAGSFVARHGVLDLRGFEELRSRFFPC